MAYQSITTGIVRMAKVRLFNDIADISIRKYKAELLLPKCDVITWQKINNTIADVVIHALQDNWRNVFLEHIRIPIHDGDGVRRDGTHYGREREGHHIIFAAGKEEPEFVDINMAQITDSSEIYSGIYALASLTFYPYLYGEKQPAIGCAISAIMKIADGAQIPANPTAAQRAFSGIQGICQRTSEQAQPYPPIANNAPHPSKENIDGEAPPFEEAGFDEMMDALKERKLSLGEFRNIMGKTCAID